MKSPCVTRSAVKERHAQRGERDEVRRCREQRRRDRQQRQADENARSSVDPAAEQGDQQPGSRHAHGAGIDGEAHGSWTHPIGMGERR
jgi:hypothetical protein